jgi:hypothetical protein
MYCADDRVSENEMESRVMHTSLGWGNVKGDHLEDIGVRGRIILKQILNNYDGRTLTEYIWLRIVTSGGL